MGRTNTHIRGYGDVNKTAVIECRCDIRDLTTILSYLDMKDHAVYSKSDLVARAIKLTANILVDSGTVKRCEDFDVARDMMRRFAKTSRDVKGDTHLSAFVNGQDFSASIRQTEAPQSVGPSPKFIEEAQKILEENLRKSDDAMKQRYVSGASHVPTLSPEASTCTFEGIPANLVGEEN